jgi:hypothetical protein
VRLDPSTHLIHAWVWPPKSGCDSVDGQPAARVLLGFILVDVGNLEVWQPLDHSEPGGKGRESACP